MNSKKVTILLVFTILLIFSVVSRIFFNDFQYGWNAYEKKDYKKAHELWLPIAEKGETRAQFFMGFMYDMGFGVPENDNEAIKWYQLAAEQGDARAQLFSGFLYDFGIGVLGNDKKALKWYKLAAAQGYTEAELNILQLESKVSPQVFLNLLDDANKGNAKSQYNLSVMYAKGIGVPKDHKKAREWFKLADAQSYQWKTNIYQLTANNDLIDLKKKATKGSGEAQIDLAIMYEFGLIVSQNKDQALKYYKLAARQGYRPAENILKQVRQNDPEEVKKIIFSANKGIAKAQYTLGMMYAEGQGVPQDKDKALKWYSHAAQQDKAMGEIVVDKFEHKNIPQELKFLTNDAENGIAEAQLKLGMLYAHGEGVPQDDDQAGKWFQLAGEKGKFKAQYILGMMLVNGQGITKDYVLAHMWYNLSRLQGNEGAKSQISALEQSMTPEQIEQAQKMLREWKPTE
jgi:uncharacterized protein